MGRWIRSSAAPIALGVALITSSLTIDAPEAVAQDITQLPVAALQDGRAKMQALTPDERQSLQEQIDAIIAETNNGGTQISANEIARNGVEPILSLPLPGEDLAPSPSETALALDGVSTSEAEGVAAAAVDWEGCPAGKDDNRWYCFYQYSGFKGRRLQWNHAHCRTGINFSDYGFNNKTTGIVNTTRNKDEWGMNLRMYHDWFKGNSLGVPPWTKISQLDSFHDNKFSSFTACRK